MVGRLPPYEPNTLSERTRQVANGVLRVRNRWEVGTLVAGAAKRPAKTSLAAQLGSGQWHPYVIG